MTGFFIWLANQKRGIMADETTTGGMPEADNGTFEAWLEGQSDEVKTRLDAGIAVSPEVGTGKREDPVKPAQ